MAQKCNECQAKHNKNKIPDCPKNHIANIGRSGLCQHCDDAVKCAEHPEHK